MKLAKVGYYLPNYFSLAQLLLGMSLLLLLEVLSNETIATGMAVLMEMMERPS